MWAILVKGGVVMIPLGLLSIMGVAVVIEKAVNLQHRRVIQNEIVNYIESVKEPSDIPMAIKLCQRYDSPFANVIRAGLEEANSTPFEVRQAMEDTGRREMKRLERYLVVLETVAAASPLLGLLGTVLGMIKVFSVISIAGVGQAGLLSGGIAEALITTAFGLSIGIPALIAYNFFDSRVDALTLKIESYAHTLIKQLATMHRSG
ncbi:MAG: MotA/TolQ/ExbB proton channel family protein [Candidatus Latescibacteria bacterium]|nr:MotA/TolQ/ExbB proton channel family protein [Candidatus Latescibacterota bacterium]NIM66478.1 MotA/TolQ/ExbB proton channel family protein [Candidatus Latescibacterota bacterium]NIO02958.1 MotA/TolQ/ExbB proton channel family protein [Candidatus Latescibacterota bacterium]NIO30093.1 MotA/TolQ/ExbB proton channel family protein [Candidatus Latescibacterota bacterium]NIO57712.1 MotA/TolQ/ExbB proton channel family protein [Candidatus Latescibacterota bacterium]